MALLSLINNAASPPPPTCPPVARVCLGLSDWAGGLPGPPLWSGCSCGRSSCRRSHFLGPWRRLFCFDQAPGLLPTLCCPPPSTLAMWSGHMAPLCVCPRTFARPLPPTSSLTSHCPSTERPSLSPSSRTAPPSSRPSPAPASAWASLSGTLVPGGQGGLHSPAGTRQVGDR